MLKRMMASPWQTLIAKLDERPGVLSERRVTKEAMVLDPRMRLVANDTASGMKMPSVQNVVVLARVRMTTQMTGKHVGLSVAVFAKKKKQRPLQQRRRIKMQTKMRNAGAESLDRSIPQRMKPNAKSDVNAVRHAPSRN
jgi:hypothetical protein